MAKRGRPKKVNAENLIKDVPVYISEVPIPIIAEFAHRNGITRQYLYELANREKEAGRTELSDALRLLAETKEIVLEKGALIGKFNPAIAKLSLKQLGWREEPESEKSGGGVQIVDDFTD